MVPPRRGDFEGPAPMGLAVNIAQFCWAGLRLVRVDWGGLGVCGRGVGRQFRVEEQPAGLEHGNGAAEVLGWPDFQSVDQLGFLGVGGGDHQGACALVQGLEGEGQDTAHRPQTAVEAQFAAAPHPGGGFGVELATGHE